MNKPLRSALSVILPYFSTSKRVLEIGSGYPAKEKKLSDFRGFFSKKTKFIGVDIVAQDGVDIVCNGEKVPFKNNYFDLVICLETLEHTKHPWLIAKEIKRVVKKTGSVIISVPFNHEIHMHPNDYYRYTPYGLKELFNFFKRQLIFSISPPYQKEVNIHPRTIVLLAVANKNINLKSIKEKLKKNKTIISGHKPYRHRIFDMLNFFKRGLNEIFFTQEIGFYK